MCEEKTVEDKINKGENPEPISDERRRSIHRFLSLTEEDQLSLVSHCLFKGQLINTIEMMKQELNGDYHYHGKFINDLLVKAKNM